MICANCNKYFKRKAKVDNECPKCGHVMMKRKSRKHLLASQHSTKVSKFRTPSLPTFSFLNDQESD